MEQEEKNSPALQKNYQQAAASSLSILDVFSPDEIVAIIQQLPEIIRKKGSEHGAKLVDEISKSKNMQIVAALVRSPELRFFPPAMERLTQKHEANATSDDILKTLAGRADLGLCPAAMDGIIESGHSCGSWWKERGTGNADEVWAELASNPAIEASPFVMEQIAKYGENSRFALAKNTALRAAPKAALELAKAIDLYGNHREVKRNLSRNPAIDRHVIETLAYDAYSYGHSYHDVAIGLIGNPALKENPSAIAYVAEQGDTEVKKLLAGSSVLQYSLKASEILARHPDEEVRNILEKNPVYQNSVAAQKRQALADQYDLNI